MFAILEDLDHRNKMQFTLNDELLYIIFDFTALYPAIDKHSWNQDDFLINPDKKKKW